MPDFHRPSHNFVVCIGLTPFYTQLQVVFTCSLAFHILLRIMYRSYIAIVFLFNKHFNVA